MRNLTLTCACLAVVAGTVSVKMWRELRTERALTAELRTKLAAAEQRNPGPQMVMLPSVAPAATEATPTASAPPGSGATNRSTGFKERDMLKNAEYRKARFGQLRLSIPQNYPGLVKELGLSPEEADRLWNLLAESQLDTSTSDLPIVNGQVDPEALRQQALGRQEAQRKLDESLVAMLGNSGYQQWRDYQDTRPSRQRAAQLTRTLESMGEPLNDAQMRSLLTALTGERKREQDERLAMIRQNGVFGQQNQPGTQEDSLRRQAESNRRIIDAAAPALNARQVETLRAALDQPLAMSRASSRVQRELAESQPQPPTGANQSVIAP